MVSQGHTVQRGRKGRELRSGGFSEPLRDLPVPTGAAGKAADTRGQGRT